MTVNDISLTAESANGQQHVEFMGSADAGYDAGALKSLADRLVETAGEGALRMQVSTFNFATGQELLDWLRANRLPFEQHRVTQ
ncbi:hypothetical protein D3C73_1613380 [compost metagenome]